MKAAVFILCLNLASWMAVEGNLAPSLGMQPFGNVTAKAEEIRNSTMTIAQSSPANLVSLVTGYIWSSFQFLLKTVQWLVLGFPTLLSTFGLPSLVTIPLSCLWFFIFAGFITEFLSGRDISG